MVKVSVILPVYNVEKYLRQCLDSIINQTLKDIEIICINDGSTDNSLNILNEYASKDSRFTVITQENQGQGVARNKGIDIAKGEYIGFVDADDWISKDFYKKLYNQIKTNNADIAVAGIVRFSKFHRKYHLKFDQVIKTDNTNLKFQICDVPEKSYVWNKIYNTEKLKVLVIYFENILYEDVIFTPKALFNLKRLVAVPETYYFYRRRAKSTITVKSDKASKDACYAYQKAKAFFTEHGIDVSKQVATTKRYKILGLTVFKTLTKGKNKTFIFLNIFKFKTLIHSGNN